MGRTTPLTTAALLGLALLAPTATASAAGATCRGEAASVVGALGTSIVGTTGRDVVVTNGSSAVTTLGGDDLICVTGPDQPDSTYVEVDAGYGDDIVDGSAAPSWPVSGALGAGADVFVGGDGPDRVFTGVSVADGKGYPYDVERDVVSSGGGDDSIVSGQGGGITAGPDPLVVNLDAVDLGDGDDVLSWHTNGPWAPESAISGGSGVDTVQLQLGAGGFRVDNALGELRHEATTVMRWGAMEDFFLSPDVGGSTLTLVGGAASERFTVASRGNAVVADLGDGDDVIEMDALPAPGSRLDGGAGRDGLTLGHDQDLAWDLTGSAIAVGADASLPAAGFEDAQLTAPRVALRGTAGPNHLAFRATDAVLRGRGGDDVLEVGTDVPEFGDYTYGFASRTTVLVGGAGDDRLRSSARARDRLVGGAGRDVLIARGGDDRVLGGPGRDLARGGAGDDVVLGGAGVDRVSGGRGRDRCVAERERGCER